MRSTRCGDESQPPRLIVAHFTSFVVFEIERWREVNHLAALEIASRIVDVAGMRSIPSAPAIFPRDGPLSRRRFHWNEVQSHDEPAADSESAPRHLVAEIRRLLVDSLGADPIGWAASGPLLLSTRFLERSRRAHRRSITRPTTCNHEQGTVMPTV
jgi:hypothetical protein